MAWNDGLSETDPAYMLATSTNKIIRSLAGPGSGKSFAIKKRIEKLIEDGVSTNKILAITFTRTSAADLRKEISTIEATGIENVLARTVHSHAMSILMKTEIQEITERNPRIIIEHELAPAFRDIDKPVDAGVKDKKKLLDSFIAGWATLQHEDPGFPRIDKEEEFESCIIEWLKIHQALLVGEVIYLALRYLRNNPASTEIGKYDAILVDEYQDLNKSEQEFIHLIRGDASIVIVGDDDQSIYGFKFAHPEGIRSIQNLYGNFQDIPFEMIRRCPKLVTQLASTLISRNKNRTLGNLIPYERNQVGVVEIVQWGDDKKEIDGLVKIIKHELEKNIITPGDILVLSPRRKIGYKLRDKLLLENIKVKSYFRESVINSEKVKRAYSLLYLFAYPEDKISIRFLLGMTSADYRKNQYRILCEFAKGENLSIRDALNLILSEELSVKGLNTIIHEYRKILEDIVYIRELLEDDERSLFSYFIKSEDDESDFYEINSIYLKALDDHPKPDDFSNEDIGTWFVEIMRDITESIALPDSPEIIDHVRIMSLHAAKGLSAKFVILTSMIEGLMPNLSSDLNEVEKERAIEEQRRLFYVAITRCKSSEIGYSGRLLISSFIWMHTTDAVSMRIPAGRSANTKMVTTRFINELGRLAPRPITGDSIIQSLDLSYV